MKKDNELIIFKVSSSEKIGSGHIYRCMKIAKKVKKRKIFFLTNNFIGNFNHLIKDYKHKILNNKESGFNIEKDLNETTDYLSSIAQKKILIIDSYFYDLNYQKQISKYVDKLVIIDDYIKKNYCDLYINENFFINKPNEKNFLKKNCKKFIGPKYSLIEKKQYKKTVQKKNNLFLFFGGSDYKGYSFKIINFLKEDKNLFFRLILNNKKIKDKILKMNIKNIKIYKQKPNFYKILNYCSFAIVAGGSVVWDILYNKISLIAIPTANNQIRNLKELKKKNKIFLLDKIQNKKQFKNFFYSSYFSKNKVSQFNMTCLGLKNIVEEITLLK